MSKVLEALRAHAANRPNELAMQGENARLTWGDVMERVTRLAQTLFPRPGLRCGLLLDNGLGWALVDLAARQAGAVLVPIPLFFSAGQIAHILGTAAVDCLITGQAPVASAVGRGVERDLTAQLGQAASFIQLEPPARAPLPGTTDKITFTSGTTGHPKGVCLAHRSIDRVAGSLMAASKAHAGDRHLALLPLATLLENIAAIDVPILAGAATVLLPLATVGLKGSSRLDPAAMLQAIEHAEATSILTVPQTLMGLVGVVARARAPERLRLVSVRGARLSRSLLLRARQLGLPVREGYGLSEASSVVAFNAPDDDDPGSVGRPLPHVTLDFAPDGEILVRGSIAEGYLGADTELQPRPDAFWPTGDLGHLDHEGRLHLDGRKKSMFVTSFGRNVSPEWVEAQLTASGSLAQAAVFGEARPWNNAVVVPSGFGDPIAEIGKVNERLPDYARVRRWLIADEPFSSMNDMATANGRLRRDQILAHYRTNIDPLYGIEIDNVL